ERPAVSAGPVLPCSTRIDDGVIGHELETLHMIDGELRGERFDRIVQADEERAGNGQQDRRRKRQRNPGPPTETAGSWRFDRPAHRRGVSGATAAHHLGRARPQLLPPCVQHLTRGALVGNGGTTGGTRFDVRVYGRAIGRLGFTVHIRRHQRFDIATVRHARFLLPHHLLQSFRFTASPPSTTPPLLPPSAARRAADDRAKSVTSPSQSGCPASRQSPRRKTPRRRGARPPDESRPESTPAPPAGPRRASPV